MRELASDGAQARPNLVQVAHRKEVAEGLDEREVRKGHFRLRTAAHDHLHPKGPRPALKLCREARLTHPCVAGHENDLSPAAIGLEEGVLEDADFVFPTDEDGA